MPTRLKAVKYATVISVKYTPLSALGPGVGGVQISTSVSAATGVAKIRKGLRRPQRERSVSLQ